MAAPIIRVKLARSKARAILRRLPRKLTGRLGGPGALYVRSLHNALAMGLLQLLQKAFKDKARGGTDEAGHRWKPLSPVTIALRQARRRDSETRLKRIWPRLGLGKYDPNRHEILIDTARLFRSLSPASSAPGRVVRITPGAIAIGTNVVDDDGQHYPKLHHYGTARIPQRRLWPPVEDWPRRWHDELRAIFIDWLYFVMRDMLNYKRDTG